MQLLPGPSNKFNVKRVKILSGAIRGLNRKSFDPRHHLNVVFMRGMSSSGGEGAVDLGGPTKEFFRLAMRAILQLPIFQGLQDCLSMLLNKVCTKEHVFR